MNIDSLRKKHIADAERIVVKIGTNVIGGQKGVDLRRVDVLSDQIAGLIAGGKQVAVVSSGAIGAGMERLNMAKRPDSLPSLQAAASVGQSRLVSLYETSFQRHGLHAGQILLTRDDFDSRSRYLNASNTVNSLFENRCVPVINENDTISTEEIQFGDNDLLAAFVTHLVQAELLVLLTSAPGLCAYPPFCDNVIVGEDKREDGRFGYPIDVVKVIDDQIRGMVQGDISPGGTGGMLSKLEAARIAVEAGEAAVIADGRDKDILTKLVSGRREGTLFLPAAEKLGSRKRWIRFSRRPRGLIRVDEGAQRALIREGRSLLPTGVISVEGNFERGDTVRIMGEGGEIARGLSNYSSTEVLSIKGRKTCEIASILGHNYFDEVIHRDNLALVN